MKIKRLQWDSDFFGKEMGEASTGGDLSDAAQYDFLLVKQHTDTNFEIKGFENSFTETKVLFSKKITAIASISPDVEVLDYHAVPANRNELYELAYESGKYSRFRLDQKFQEAQFKRLYDKWIDNSIEKKFADAVLYTSDNFRISGFITIKKHMNSAAIGLIAVSEGHQGKGLGTVLLKAAENYCLLNTIPELKIPTQAENNAACNFYKKMGYQITETTIMKHYWKI